MSPSLDSLWLVATENAKCHNSTFLSLDEDGRVLRLDSLSKFMAPGMRVGWITAPEDFISKYQLLQEISSQVPPHAFLFGTPSHNCAVSLRFLPVYLQRTGAALGRGGHAQARPEGMLCSAAIVCLIRCVWQIQGHYKSQRDVTLAAVKEFFRPGLCSFVTPTCGMFVWLTFHVPQSSFELFQLFADAGVITVPGVDFFVPGVTDEPADGTRGTPVRLTFAAASPEQIRKAVKSMADCINPLQQR